MIRIRTSNLLNPVSGLRAIYGSGSAFSQACAAGLDTAEFSRVQVSLHLPRCVIRALKRREQVRWIAQVGS